jgi:hypothetical protein
MTQILPEQSENPSDKDSETSSSSPQGLQEQAGDLPTKQPKWLIGTGGRKPGSRNKITAQKLQIEEALRDQLNQYMPEVIQKAIEMAIKGDRTMIKLLVEMTMSKPQAVDDESSGKERVQITVRKLNLELQQPKPLPIQVTSRIIEHGDKEASDGSFSDSGSGSEGGDQQGS